jgi:hypothetical protein
MQSRFYTSAERPSVESTVVKRPAKTIEAKGPIDQWFGRRRGRTVWMLNDPWLSARNGYRLGMNVSPDATK